MAGVESFIPDYPSLENENFGYDVARKKEFYELRLERSEPSNKPQGELLESQKFMKRFFSPNTPYDRALVFGLPGTGKCVHPDTVLSTSIGDIRAETLWDSFAYNMTNDGEGEWGKSKLELFVQSYDEQCEWFISSPILNLYRQFVRETLINISLTNGSSITITKQHHLFDGSEWTKNFELGGIICVPSSDGLVKMQIVSLTDIEYEGFVYDFEIEDHHNYVANGILCHNTCIGSAIAENFKNTQYGGKQRKPTLVFVKSEDLRESYMNEIANVCTKDVYKPQETEAEKRKGVKMTEGAKLQRLHKSIKKNYKIVTYETFLKNLDDDETLRQKYNGCTILIDEAHVLKIQPPRKVKPGDGKQSLTQGVGDDDLIEELGDLEGEANPDVIPDPTDIALKDAVMLYKQMHHFLHIVQDTRILLFTGTPIWDQTYEIASLMNLILEDSDPRYGERNQQLPTGTKFERAFFDGDGILTEKGTAILKERFRGKVSFLRTMVTTAVRTEMGTVKPWLQYVTVFPCQMSEFQAASAREARENAVTKIVKGAKGKAQERIITGGTVKKLAIDSMNMVLPVWDKNGDMHGEYGPDVFKRYAEFTRTKMGGKNKKLITQYKLTDAKLLEQLKNNLQEYSAKLAAIIEHAKANPKEVIFIYNEHVTGPGGSIMDAMCLELHGFLQARSAGDIAKPSTKRRFAVITAHDQTIHEVKQIQSLLKSHNESDNCYGDRLQIIIGSEKVALGFTIKHVRRVYIQTPHWNIPAIEQAMARGFRFGSHDALKPEERYIRIYKLVAVEAPGRKEKEYAKGKGYPSDAAFSDYKTMDIEVYSTAERKEHKNTQIYRLLKEASFDCALNYRRNVLPEDVDGTRECDYQECNYICDGYPEDKIGTEGKVYDYSIPDEDLDYSTYNLLYSDDKIKFFKEEVKKLFNNYFSLTFEMLKNELDVAKEDVPALLSAIDSIIETRSLIRNRYGFGCYLKEQGGILFLDNSISPKANYPEATYIENPLVTEKTTMDAFVEILELESDKEGVVKMCKTPSTAIYDKLSHRTKIVLLEASYVWSKTKRAKKGSVEPSPDAVDFILKAGAEGMLHKMSDGVMVHILYTEEFKGVAYDVAAKDIKVTGLMRMYDDENETWKYVENREQEEKYVKELKTITAATTAKDDTDNPYGVTGWISKRDKQFRIQLEGARGKKCPTFSKPVLIDIFIQRIGFFPESRPEFKGMKKKELISKIRGRPGFEEYKDDLEDQDEKYLRGLLTLLNMSIADLCEHLEKWFKDNDLLTTK